MENSPSSKPRASTSEQLRSIGFTLALISLPIIAGTCGNIFDVLKLPVAKATKPSKEPTKPTKSSESKEKQEETVLTQEAVRKILEEKGHDVDTVIKKLRAHPKVDSWPLTSCYERDILHELLDAGLRKVNERRTQVSLMVEVSLIDGEPTIVLFVHQTETGEDWGGLILHEATERIIPGSPPLFHYRLGGLLKKTANLKAPLASKNRKSSLKYCDNYRRSPRKHHNEGLACSATGPCSKCLR
jgi:hypothetical protein